MYKYETLFTYLRLGISNLKLGDLFTLPMSCDPLLELNTECM